MDNKSNNFFWPSYVDLMTVLFAIALVLFVLSFKLFDDRSKELVDEKGKVLVIAEKYEKIKDIEKQIQAIENTGKFDYDNVYKRFILKDLTGKEIFKSHEDKIKEEYKNPSIEAGICVRKLLEKFSHEKNLRFMIVIEGNTANKWDGSLDKDDLYGYKLSYKRALALYNLWLSAKINFPKGTEIIISGSGFSGVGRDPIEENNKRFLIHIIPKIEKF
jgi:hypothetical protein